ncbi:WD40-repeat-containing domain protein [Entophlyctis helioformis]|nr:WD40-repeat-containing domain protein [Entophlyctis helioformis]
MQSSSDAGATRPSSSITFPDIRPSAPTSATPGGHHADSAGSRSARKSRPTGRESAGSRGRIQMRARNTDLKPPDPQSALPVQPWSLVKSHITGVLGSKNLLQVVTTDEAHGNLTPPAANASKSQSNTQANSNNAASSGSASALSSAPSSGPSSAGAVSATRDATGRSGQPKSTKSPQKQDSLPEPNDQQQQQQQQQQANAASLPITITHGFQLLRTLANPRPTIKSVLYIPNSSMFVSLDSSYIYLWKGGARIHKVSTQPENDKNGRRQPSKKGSGMSGNGHLPGVVAISKWIYLDRQRVYIVANTRLELKVLDIHFEELAVISNPKPVLSIESVPDKNEIICGEVGSIRIWRVVKSNFIHMEVYNLEERRVITHNLEEEWVAFVYYDRLLDRIFAACDSNLYASGHDRHAFIRIYDYASGERIDNFYNIHELGITCVTFYEPFEYIITGGKDGSIKIWNARKFLMFDFHEHFNAITGMALLEKGCEGSPGSIPLLLSSSLDATIRMWNFETGQSLYRLDTHQPCLGISFIKKNHFYHYTNTSVQLWNVNRYQLTFVFFRSTPLIMRRVTHPGKPPRILTAIADGSVKMISPVTGIVIATGFPVHKDAITKEIAYNMSSETLYSFNTNGDIILYDSNANPFKILDIWELSKTPGREQITCICGLEFYNHKMGSNADADRRIVPKSRRTPKFFLVAGSENGQILLLDLEQRGKQELLVQAHSAKITMLAFDPHNLYLISGGEDYLIKVWALRSVEGKVAFGGGLMSGMATMSTTQSISVVHGRPCNGGIVVADYLRDVTLTPGKAEQDQTGKVCIIASDTTLAFKIWDADNTIIREIQFNDVISSLCFANARGDLLVGISDQISIVRVQDYMPYNILKLMVGRDYEDDETEIPIAFDPNLDFWEYRYETEKEEHGKVQEWHMQKYAMPNKHHVLEGRLTPFGTPESRSQNRTEKAGFMHAWTSGTQKEPEARDDDSDKEAWSAPTSMPRLAEPKPLAMLRRGSPPTTPPVETDHDADARDNQIKEEESEIQQGQTDTQLEQVSDQLQQLDQKEDASAPGQDGSAAIAAEAQLTAARQSERLKMRERMLKAHIALPNSTLIGEMAPTRNRQRKAKKDKLHIKSKSRKEGGQSDSSGEEEQDQEFLKDIWGAGGQDGSGKGAGGRPSAAAASAMDAARQRRQKAQQAQQAYFDKTMDVNLEDDDDELTGSNANLGGAQLQREFSPDEPLFSSKKSKGDSKKKGGKGSRRRSSIVQKPKSGSRDDLSRSKPTLATQSEEPPTEARPTTASKADQQAGMPQPVTSVSVSVPSLAKDQQKQDEQQQQQPQQDDQATKEEPIGSQDAPTGQDPGAVAAPAADPVRAGRPVTHLEFQPLNPHVVDISRAWEMRKPPTEPKAFVLGQRNAELYGSNMQASPPSALVKIRKTLQRTNEAAANYGSRRPSQATLTFNGKMDQQTSDISQAFDKYKKQKPALLRSYSEEADLAVEEAAHFVWDMFRNYQDPERITESLKPLTNYFAAGELEEKPSIEISTVANVLGNILKTGTPDQLMDASKALLFLYQTFREDFRSPLSVFISPQLDQLTNPDAEVRSVLCENVTKFGVYHDTILLGLIYCLNDRESMVVEAAMRGLAQFGITDKAMLRAAMIHLGMINGEVVRYYEDAGLDRIAREIRIRELQQNRQTNFQVQHWLDQIDLRVLQMRRQDSYYEHLAGIFFPPDAGDRDGIVRSRLMNEKSLGIHGIEDTLSSLENASADVSFASMSSYLDGWDIRSNRSQKVLRQSASQQKRKASLLHADVTLNAINEQSEEGSTHGMTPPLMLSSPNALSSSMAGWAMPRNSTNTSRAAVTAPIVTDLGGITVPHSSKGSASKHRLLPEVHHGPPVTHRTTPTTRSLTVAIVKNVRAMTAGAIFAKKGSKWNKNTALVMGDVPRPSTTGGIFDSSISRVSTTTSVGAAARRNAGSSMGRSSGIASRATSLPERLTVL